MISWAVPNICEEDKNFAKTVIDSEWYTMGRIVKEFESKMSVLAKRNYSLAVNNGTSAIEIMLRALEIGHGDEVIVPAYSYIATATAVRLVGASPVFVDVDKNMCINPKCIGPAVNGNTKAVLAVDLAGNPSNYSLLNKKAKKYG